MDESRNRSDQTGHSLSREEIRGYVEGTLSPEEMRRVEEILVDSPMDADAVEGYELLGAEVAENLIDDINTDIDIIAGSGRETKVRSIAPMRWMAAASVLVLMGIGAWYFGTQLDNTGSGVSQRSDAPVMEEADDAAENTLESGESSSLAPSSDSLEFGGGNLGEYQRTEAEPIQVEDDGFFPMYEPAEEEIAVAEEETEIPTPAYNYDLADVDLAETEVAVTAEENQLILDAISTDGETFTAMEMDVMEDEEMLPAAGSLASDEFGNIDVDSFVFARLEPRMAPSILSLSSSGLQSLSAPTTLSAPATQGVDLFQTEPGYHSSFEQQSRGVIRGRVTDLATGEGLIGAAVQIPGEGIGVLTDIDGYYELQVAAGRHEVEVAYVGYDRREEPILLGEGEQRNLDISLDASALALDEVVIASKEGKQKDRRERTRVSKKEQEDMTSRAATAQDRITDDKADDWQSMPGSGGNATNYNRELPDDPFARGVDAYQNSDTVTAFNFMQETLEERPAHEEAALYSGLILLESKRPADAVSYLEGLLSRNPGGSLEEEARWYLALSYLALRNRDSAEPLLRQISVGEGPFARIASKTLEDLSW